MGRRQSWLTQECVGVFGRYMHHDDVTILQSTDCRERQQPDLTSSRPSGDHQCFSGWSRRTCQSARLPIIIIYIRTTVRK